jgi:hypothetical protein
MRLKKSDGGELEINRQDLATSKEAILLPSVVVSDEAILLPYVATSDARGAQQNFITSNAGGAHQIVTTSDAGGAQQIVITLDARGAQQNVAKDNIGTSNEVVDDRSVDALDRETSEHNCALSQLKQKDSIGIDCFRIRGH